MPRIRTVKPDLWTDSKIVGLSLPARLMFIGSWNFADDYGCLPADPMQLKLRVLPADQVDAGELARELVEAGLLEELVSTSGVVFWHIRNWNRHQRVSKPTPSEFGDPTSWKSPRIPANPPEDSVLLPESGSEGAVTSGFAESPAAFVEESGEISRSGKGREGSGTEGKGKDLAPRALDEVWDTLAELFGDPTTSSNRTLRGKLNASLKRAGATSDEIRRRVRAWPHHFPDATLTETALEKHWDRLGRPVARAGPGEVDRAEAEYHRQMQMERARLLDAQARGLPE